MFEDEKINEKIDNIGGFRKLNEGLEIVGVSKPYEIFEEVNEERPMVDDSKTEQDVAKAIDKEARDRKRFFSLLHTIFYICRLAGFKIEGRITMRDLRTGKVWK